MCLFRTNERRRVRLRSMWAGGADAAGADRGPYTTMCDFLLRVVPEHLHLALVECSSSGDFPRCCCWRLRQAGTAARGDVLRSHRVLQGTACAVLHMLVVVYSPGDHAALEPMWSRTTAHSSVYLLLYMLVSLLHSTYPRRGHTARPVLAVFVCRTSA